MSLLVAGAASAVQAPTAHAAPGDGFSFAPVTANGTTADAFAPADRAWWAGVCDLHAGSFAIGSDPGTRYPHCIDHPFSSIPTGSTFSDQLQPPLQTGVSPDNSGSDGWIRQPDTPADGPGWRLADVTEAGAHPDGTASFWFSRAPDFVGQLFPSASAGPDGAPRNIRVSLPPGVIGNPNAVPKCPSDALHFAPALCPAKTQVGVSTISLGGYTAVFPVYNVEPRDGKTAELIVSGAGISTVYQTNAPVVASARTDGDFGVDAAATSLPAAVVVHSQTFTLWGVPWAASHDRYRPAPGYCHALTGSDPFGTNAWQTPGMPVRGLPGGTSGGCSQNPVSYDPSWGPIRPFLTTQTECSSDNPRTAIEADNYHTDVVASGESVAPIVDGCENLDFDATFSMDATSTAADSAAGLSVDLTVPQNNDPPASVRFDPDDDTGAPAYWKSTDGLATSHLKDSVVTLPEGFSVNPSAATGLAGCSDAQIGLRQVGNPPLFNNEDPFDGAGPVECPAGSVIGTAEVITPLLEEKLTGQVVLGTPKSTDPQSGEMFRMFLVLRNRERGLVAKIYGSAVADPATGRLTATFANNPQLPFDNLELQFKGGSRGLLATPQRCGGHGWTSTFAPWSGGASVPQGGQFPVNADCGFGFAPSLQAGMDSTEGRGSGAFSFRMTRPQGQQNLRGLTAKLPTGLLASVKDVPLCTDAQASVGACALGSQIGIVDAKAGSGNPFVLERKGRVYLTEGYKGGEYGLAVVVRPVAGPFRGAQELSPIIVRQAIHVDRKTAQVTAISDPFPLIHHGIPLRVREITVKVDRDNFMLNPSDCSAKQVDAAIGSAQGTTANRSNRFQASGCRALDFEPRIGLRLKGRRQVKTGGHPAVRARVRQQGVGEAGIEQAEVRLPTSFALDVNNAQALCEFEDGTKPDIENHCPKGSIVGRARAISPLLKDPLVGNVFFVKNIRIDEETGNEIRTLPMLVVALRGEISVNLTGESSVDRRNRLVNTFDDVPDAPISRFNMNIRGGRNGILTVTRTKRSEINLCKAGRQVAEADTDGQNGKRHDFNIVMRKPCPKGRPAAARVCRKRTNNRRALRRCVVKVKRNRAQQAKRRVAKRKAAKRQANRRNASS